MESLSLGSLSTSSGSPRLSGTASKLDTAAIVEATYEAARFPAVRLETKITKNEAKIAAFSEMRSQLTALKDAMAPLRNPPGYLGKKDNIFETKAAYFSSSSTTPPTDLVGLSVDNSAEVGSFELVVNQLATANKLSSDSAGAADETLADAWNGGVAFSGSLDIGVAGGTTASVAVDGTMDIYDLRDAINGESSTTGVRASVLKVSATDYRLVMTAEETGKAISITDGSGLAAGFNTTELQAAQQAEFEIDGVTILRDSNQIDDLMVGATINLFKADPGTTVSVNVEPSLGDVKDQIAQFVEAYNSFRNFVDGQSALTANGEVAEEAVLYGDRTMRDIMFGLSGFAGGAVEGLDANALSTLSSIGITINASNQLSVDDGKLDSALLTDLSSVRAIFEFSYTTSSDELAIYERTNNFSDNDFTVDITDADNDGVPESVTIDGIAAEIDGSTIRGAAGTAYEGLEMLWVGSGSTSIDVSATQGIADKLYNYLDEKLDTYQGSITEAVGSIEDLNVTYADRMQAIEDRADRARETLIERFATMEANLSIANAMLEQIRAQVDAMTASN